MPKKKIQSNTQTTASSGHCEQCIRYLRFCGGKARLHNLNFSQSVISALITQGLVQVKNSGTGFFLELSSDQ